MKTPPLLITQHDLDQAVQAATLSPRRRKNLNVHQDLSAPVQRLFNAMEPGTYIRVHRHTRANGWELMVCIQGAFSVLLFEEDGEIRERADLDAQGPYRAIEVPANTWHTVVSNQPGTIMFEVKEGPYSPVEDKDFAAWAPREESPLAAGLLAWLEDGKPGMIAPTS